MVDASVGDLVVVRFSPISVDKLRESAEDEFRTLEAEGKPPRYALSTRALRIEADEDTVDTLVERICRDSGLTGKYVHVVTDRQLSEVGFSTERTDPPIHHYDVVLGQTLRDDDLERLSELFGSARRRHPLWTK